MLPPRIRIFRSRPAFGRPRNKESGEPTNQTCTSEKAIWRREDIKEHITLAEHLENQKNDEKVQERIPKSLTYKLCFKVFKTQAPY